MISHKLKFIFIHIPKTSGNSLSLFLKDCLDNKVIQGESRTGKGQGIEIICEINNKDIKHETIDYYNKVYGNSINDYFKFTIVRNPYDRILSFYFWSKADNKNSQSFNRNEFIEFIKNNWSYQYKHISEYFYTVHYENLIKELKQIKCFQDKYNFDNYPELNVSFNNKIDRNAVYDQELKDLVYNKFKKDFELFGYERG